MKELSFRPLPNANYKYNYVAICEELNRMQREDDIDGAVALMREMCKRDLFFLMYFVLGIHKLNDHAWLVDRVYEVDSGLDKTLQLWAREHFKDLDVDTPILTSMGWKRHGDLCAGDKVFNRSGDMVTVNQVTPIYSGNRCLKIVFQDGHEIVCGETHEWELIRHTREKRDTAGKRKPKRVKYLCEAKDLKIGDDVGVAEDACNFDAIELPIDPYTLGVWLGDGHSKASRITNTIEDIEVIQRIAHTYPIHSAYSSDGKTFVYGIGGGVRGQKGTGLSPLLREVGVLNNKHIPEIYKFSSAIQRMELLRGLMDTDGTTNGMGTATFVNINKRLAEDVYEVASTLGLRPRFNTFGDDDYPVYYVSMQHHKDRDMFFLPRKSDRAIAKSQHRNTRKIVRIEEVPSRQTNCIDVEGGVYLAGKGLIPTHNSTIISFGAVVKFMLCYPEKRVCIMSYNRSQAKALLRRIKETFEMNGALYELFPDVCWAQPKQEAPKWSEDEGITLKRKTVFREASLEAWGLVDGMPTGSHYDWRLYDDIVTQDNTGTAEQIRKTIDAFGMSHNLGTVGGMVTVVGTIYHFSDLLVKLKTEGVFRDVTHAAEVDGKGVLMPDEVLAEKKKLMGSYIYACQMMLNPVAEDNQVFRQEWLRYHDGRVSARLNKYIVVDPAGQKGAKSDYTVMWVFGIDSNYNYYILDCVRDKLSLSERWLALKGLVEKHSPIMNVGYEKYGMQGDIEYMKENMEREGFYFSIDKLGGFDHKERRIKTLQPRFQAGEIIIPKALMYIDQKGNKVNITDEFIKTEYLFFPYSSHDDMLDCMARMLDPELGVVAPTGTKNRLDMSQNETIFTRMDRNRHTGSPTAWMV